MRIFLSYAAERLGVAQQVDAALEAEGHEVFFARDSIAAATRFGTAIREAVAESDLLVYLVSPESVEPGSYCLTELGYARERWPDPAGRVLPVVVAATPPESFPSYVQGLSALYPTGNLPAEVAASVERVRRGNRRSRVRAGSIALAVLCALAGAGAALWGRARDGAADRPFLSVAALAEVRPAVAGEPALVLVRGNARNPSPRVDSIVRLDLDLDGGARAEPAGRLTPIHIDGGGGENFAEWFRLSMNGGTSETPRRWRVCVGHAGRSGRTCGSWSDWAEGPLAIAPPIAEELRRRSRVVAAGNAGFLIGLGSPGELLVLRGGGESVHRVPLPGEPAALAAGAGRVAVGTRAPGVLVVMGPGTERSEHQVPGGRVSGSAASTGVASVAVTDRETWVITGGADGEQAVRLFDLASRRWVALPYAEDRSEFDPRGIHLRAGPSGTVWGVTTGTTRSSLYRLDRTGVVELRGRSGPDEFRTVADLDPRFFPFVKGDRRAEWIAGAGDTLALAVTVLASDPVTRDPVPLVSRIGWSLPGLDRALIGFERDSVAVTSLAVLDTLALAAVTSVRGVRDLVAVPLRRR